MRSTFYVEDFPPQRPMLSVKEPSTDTSAVALDTSYSTDTQLYQIDIKDARKKRLLPLQGNFLISPPSMTRLYEMSSNDPRCQPSGRMGRGGGHTCLTAQYPR